MTWRLRLRLWVPRVRGSSLAFGVTTVLFAGGGGPAVRQPAAPIPPMSAQAVAKTDSFPHERHTKVACLECHELGSGHGRVKFERPAGCFACHHQEANQTKCMSCHVTEKVDSPKHVTVTITVRGRQPKPRPVDFMHEKHTSRQCVECHTTPGTLMPGPTKATCQDCHTEHHATGRTCSVCHTLADPKVEHKSLQIAHQNCDACHTATTIAKLTPTRSLCSTCHAAKARNHYDQKECTVCHFLAEPSAYKASLMTPKKP